jgi:hypothetical protein
MTKTINAAFATALFAASVFGGSAALAGGDYYKGAYPESENSRTVDHVRTNSINGRYVVDDRNHESVKVGPANGDYYQGNNPDAR